MDDSSKAQQARFEAVFQQYLDVYMKERNLKKLDEMVSENFSGFGTGMDENFYSKAKGMEIFQRDIQSAPNELRHNIHRHEVKLMDQSNAIAVTELDLKTTIADQEIKLNNLRLLLLMHEEAGIIKITGMHISFPTEVHDEGESYPLKELEERYQVLKKMVDEKTKRQQEIIYQLQEAKDALREKTKFLENIIDTTSDLVAVTDMEGNFKFIGPSHRFLGYDPDSLIGRNVMELVHPDDYQETATAFVEFLANKEDGRKVEYRYRRVDGDYLWFETVGKFILDDAGNPKKILFSSRDVTERKQAEDALKKSEAKYRLITENMAEIITTMDMNLNFTYVSPSIIKLRGFTVEEALEQKIDQIMTPESFQRLSKVFAEEFSLEQTGTADPGRSRIIELEEYKKDGSTIWIENTASFIRDSYQKPIGIISISRDITDRKKAEEELRESEARFKALHNASFGGIAIHDQGVILECNQGLSEMTGYQYSELIGMNGLLLIAERSRKKVMNNIRTGYEKPYEAFGLRKNGEEFPMQLEARNVPYKGKQVRTVEFRDITERKKAEEALKSNFTLLQTAGETAIFGGWSVDLEKNICTWSDAVADIHDVPHGYSPPVQEAINFYAPEWREKITHIFSACAKDGIPYDEEMEIITQKGKHVWVRTTGKAVKNEKDKIIKVQGSFQDITDKKQVEEELKAERDQIFSLFNSIDEIIYIADPQTYELLYINRHLADLLPKNCIGKKCYKVLQNLDSPCSFCTNDIIFENMHEPHRWEYYNPFLDQHYAIIDRVIRWSDGRNVRFEMAVDISGIKKTEAEKEKLQTQLNQAQKMESVGRLAGGVAHDFNNMLGVILGHTELALLQADESHELHDDLKEIQNAAKRSADITKQLLAFARKQTISPRQLDLNNTVESMLKMLRRLIGEDIDLVWQPSAHLWPVKMDPAQIDQILANLCINAKDAISGVGKLTIETGKKSFDEEYCKDHPGFIPGDFVLLAVSDNGCGMDKETLDNLFEPFFTTKEVGKGTGLGLATIYGIVKQNNGFINVYSEPGQGSTFRIYLPRLVADEDIDKAVAEKKAAVGGSETILLVEDEPTILRMTRMMLERKGYSVLTAATPGEAIKKTTNHSGSIDLLMTDVVMPEMNGRDLSGQITDLYPDIKLLFMSGYTADIIAQQGILDKGVAFIQKPFSMADMTEKVRDVLDSASDKS